MQLHRYLYALHTPPQRSSDPPRRNLGLTDKQTRTIATGTSFALLWLTVGPTAQAAVTRTNERGHTRKLNKIEMARILGSQKDYGDEGPPSVADTAMDFVQGTGDAQPWQGQSGDVSTVNGNKVTDLSLVGWKVKGGRLGIGFTLTHNSKTTTNTFVGRKWTHTYDIYLSPSGGSGGGGMMGGSGGPMVHWGDDTSYGFTQNIDGSYSATTGHYDTMTVTGSGTSAVYTITSKDQTKYQFVSTNGTMWWCNQIKDRNNNSVTISRNTDGGVTSVSDGNRSLTFAYTSGKITSVSDPLSRTWTLSYDTNGDLTQVAFPLLAGNSTTYSIAYGYNSNHDITSLTDRRGKVWGFGYNSSDSITSETDPLNHGTTYSYTSGTSTASQTVITDALGHTTKHNYTNGVLSSVQDAGNYTESYSYDTSYNKTYLTDKRGKVWGYTYDSRGNVLTSTDPLSHTVTNTYNTKNDVLTQTTSLGFVTSYSYDTAGNLTGVSDPLSHSTTYTIGTYGQVTSITDALNHTSYVGYDSNGNATSVADALGHIKSTGYNTLGWATSSTDGTNLTTSTSYDNWGRAATVTAPGSRAVSMVYNANGNRTSATDPLGKVATSTYDDAGRLTSSTDPLSRTVYYAYDNANRKTGFMDGRGKVTSYAYTSRNQLSSISYPDNTSDSYTYNAAGALSTKTDGRGVTITSSYDDAGRLTGKGYSNGDASVSFAYDNDNRKTGMTDGTGTTSYSYDNASRLTSRSAPGANVLSVGFGYDNANRLTSRTTAGSSMTTFAYDNANRMTSTSSPGPSGALTTSYTYDSANRQLSITSPNAVQTSTYDSATADLTGIVSKNASNVVVDSHSYTYRADGRKTSETSTTLDINNGQVSSVSSYTYDDAGQLTAEARTGTAAFTAGYSYDLAGNRASKTLNSVTESYVYDDANKLLSAGGKTFTYDNAGNRTSVTEGGTTTNLLWDAEERLTYTGTGNSSNNYTGSLNNNFTYNGLGQRVFKHEGGGANMYFTLSDDSIDSPVLDDGNSTYLQGTGLIGEVWHGNNPNVLTYQTDALGTTRGKMFADGGVYFTLSPDAFGMPAFQTNSFMQFGFGGQHGYQSDYSTGLMRLGHRYYDASTGQFISRDPIQAGNNWYTYCNNDPVNAVDPQGLAVAIAIPILLIGVAIIFTVALLNPKTREALWGISGAIVDWWKRLRVPQTGTGGQTIPGNEYPKDKNGYPIPPIPKDQTKEPYEPGPARWPTEDEINSLPGANDPIDEGNGGSFKPGKDTVWDIPLPEGSELGPKPPKPQ